MANTTKPTIASESVESQLQQICAHGLFVQAERQIRFLQYIVTETLADRGHKLNQYMIGIDVFDRDESFDPVVDSIVRVEAGRLRAKLLEYYNGPGVEDPILIHLPKGQYKVEFASRQTSTVASKQEQLVKNENPVVAVLPFQNNSDDSEQDYFTGGITEDLITELSKLSGLSVIAGNSTFKYKDSKYDIKDIAAELGADFILQGSIRKSGNRTRITAQLSDVQKGNAIWAERYDRELTDIFAVQDDVTQKIINELKLSLTQPERARMGHKGTDNLEAYDCVLRGVEYVRQSIQDNLVQAKGLYRRAIELDANYAEPCARISMLYVYEWIVGISGKTALDKARTMAERALELDQHLPLAHSAMGWVHQWHEQYDDAISEWNKALELDPNHISALDLLALNLAWRGEIKAAIEKLDCAKRLNPLEPYFFVEGVIAFMDDDFFCAIRYLNKRLEAEPSFVPGHIFLAASYEFYGEHEKAKYHAAEVLRISPDYKIAYSNSLTVRVPEKSQRFRKALVDLGLPQQ